MTIYSNRLFMSLGSKENLLPVIMPVIAALPGVHRAADLVAGALHVAMAMKRAGK
jgi:hypothetical protein